MAWTTPRTWVVAEVLTAALLNTHVKDNENAIKSNTFAGGEVAVFFQAAAPTGWTKVTTQNDKALRVVSGTGGGSGGVDSVSTPPQHTHTYTDVVAHTHPLQDEGSGGNGAFANSGGTPAVATRPTNSTGVATGTTAAQDGFRPYYIDVLICSKDAW